MRDCPISESTAVSQAIEQNLPLVLYPTRSQPAGDRERIVPLDALRGFALLGILVMTIQAFAMIDAAYMNPTAYGDLSGANFRVWRLSHVLAD